MRTKDCNKLLETRRNSHFFHFQNRQKEIERQRELANNKVDEEEDDNDNMADNGGEDDEEPVNVAASALATEVSASQEFLKSLFRTNQHGTHSSSQLKSP